MREGREEEQKLTGGEKEGGGTMTTEGTRAGKRERGHKVFCILKGGHFYTCL